MEDRKHLRKSLVDDGGKKTFMWKSCRWWRKENIYVKVLSMMEERKHLRKSLVDDRVKKIKHLRKSLVDDGGKKTFT